MQGNDLDTPTQVADTAVLGTGLFANDRVAFVW